MTGSFVVLCGGVGGSKLAAGMAQILPPEALTIVANTGDDFDHLGLRICPDIDTITYMLSGLVNTETGWGRGGETWSCMETLRQLEGEDWFLLGDRDLALHLHRTDRLSKGYSLSEVTQATCNRFGVEHAVVPATEDPIRTRLETDEGWLDFQEYFVRRKCEPRVSALKFVGSEAAHLAPRIERALNAKDLRAIFIAPSNPLLSIAPILAIPGMREACKARGVPIIAVSPFIRGQSVKGPAAKLLSELGNRVGNDGLAEIYGSFLDGVVAHSDDEGSDDLPYDVLYTNTLMKSAKDRAHVARACISLLESVEA